MPMRAVQRAKTERARPTRRLVVRPRRVRSAMKITRKSFVSGAALGLAGLVFLPATALAAPPEGFEEEPLGLRRAVGESFWARGAGGVLVPLGLERSVDVRSDTSTEQFSLYFTADEEYLLAEGTWRLVGQSGRREWDVFLVPAGTNASGQALYRADFCLLRGARRPAAQR